MKSPAFQFYVTDYLGSQRVQMLSLEEEGAYIRLLAFCWQHGSIPSDPKQTAKLIGKGCSTNLARVVLGMFIKSSTDPDRMVHDRLETEREKQVAWREKCSVGGQNSAKLKKTAPRVVELLVEPLLHIPIPSSFPHSIKTNTGNGSSLEMFNQIATRLSKVFNRTENDRLTCEEEQAISQISRRPAVMNELEEIESFQQKEQKYFPRTLTKVVTNWQSVLDSARMWKPNLTPDEARRRKNLIAQWA
jgi:uncharacterized protein YdaU (DUF1376 family)